MQRHAIPGALMAMLLVLTVAACGTSSDSQATASAAPPSGEPIVVGSTLALTGPLGGTGNIHRIAGELFVDRLNEAGGLLGRPVEWEFSDDESLGDNVGPAYEQLITQDQVDLIMGPYATPLIVAAQEVARRHGYVLPQHTAVHALLMDYECQFPAWSLGPEPNVFQPNALFDAFEAMDNPPESIVLVSNQGGSTDFIARGVADDPDDPGMITIAADRGIEVLADIGYPPPPGTPDWAAIAQQVAAEDADAVVMLSLGVESVALIEAMEQLDYRPPVMFSLFPAPGPLLGLGEAAAGHLSVSVFEPNEAILERFGDEVREITEEFSERAAAADIPYTVFETQAASSWTAWEILVAGVEAAGDLDQQAICDALHENGADTTFHGQLSFDPEGNNFWPSDQGIKQIQDADWIMVFPEDIAAGELQGP